MNTAPAKHVNNLWTSNVLQTPKIIKSKKWQTFFFKNKEEKGLEIPNAVWRHYFWKNLYIKFIKHVYFTLRAVMFIGRWSVLCVVIVGIYCMVTRISWFGIGPTMEKIPKQIWDWIWSAKNS